MSDEETPFDPPNGPAYERSETRTGPPLDYVAEKQRRGLEQVHTALHRTSANDDATKRDLHAAFQYALVSYLALNNLLALANDHDRIQQIAELSKDDFRDWLDRIEQEGSVTG